MRIAMLVLCRAHSSPAHSCPALQIINTNKPKIKYYNNYKRLKVITANLLLRTASVQSWAALASEGEENWTMADSGSFSYLT